MGGLRPPTAPAEPGRPAGPPFPLPAGLSHGTVPCPRACPLQQPVQGAAPGGGAAEAAGGRLPARRAGGAAPYLPIPPLV